MNKKDRNWHKILNKSSISDKFKQWVKNDNSSSTFEIENNVIKEINARPGKTIPLYHQKQIPKPLKDHNLELFRHKLGSCVLTKTGMERNLPSIIPKLPNCKIIETKPYEKISPKSLLLRREKNSEENGFFIAQRTGVLKNFLEKILEDTKIDDLEHCGRLQGNVSSSIKIGDDKITIHKANFEIDHVLENDEIIIPLELKKGFNNSHSIHQLILPLLHLNKHIKDQRIVPIYFETDVKGKVNQPKFRLFYLDIEYDETGVLSIPNCSYKLAIEYQITSFSNN